MPESNDTPDGWSEAAAAKQSEALQGLRLQIDAVDRELLALLNRRASLSLEVGRVKANTSGPVFRPQRERQILDNLASENSGPLPEEHLRSIWHEIFASSRTLQRPVSVAYLGPEGTNSYFAAVDLLGNLMDYRPCKNFREAFAAVHGGECALGVIPLENVLQGSVGQCFDLFMEYDVYIQTESVARIQHTLLSVESSPKAIKVVYSHPQALAQCQRWLRQHLPEASLMACDSTAAAARRAVSEPGSAAIGHKSLSTMLGLPILAYNLEDEYFEQAYEFIKSLDVTQLHVFSYSERPGTQALKIDHVVTPEEKHRRSQRLLELSDEKTHAFYARHIGQTLPVLLERSKPGTPMHGFTANYIRVEVPHNDTLDNQVVPVRLGDFNEDGTALQGMVLL